MNFDNRTDPYWYYNNSLYNHHKRPIIGGLILEKDKLLDKIKSDSIEDIEKVKRAYERGLDDIERGSNYDDEYEQERDKEQLENMIEILNNRIEILNNEKELEREEIEREEIKREEEKRIKLDRLAEIFENLQQKKQGFEELKKLPELYYSNIKGKEFLLDKVKEINKERREANKRRPNTFSKDELGYGKIWEEVYQKYLNDKKTNNADFGKDLGSKSIKNNEEHSFYKNEMTYTKDDEGNWVQVPLSKYLIYDLSGKKQDIENKMYASDTFGISYDDVKDGKKDIPLQISKLGMYSLSKTKNKYIPYFSEKLNGEIKLYNVWDDTNKQWVNKHFNKDLYIMYMLNDGIYELKLNNPDYLPLRTQNLIKDDKNNNLFIYDEDEILTNPDYEFDAKNKTINVKPDFLRKHRIKK